MATREEDIRACVLEGCHRVGLYPQLADPNGDAFLDRVATELVEAADEVCPVAPPYGDVLMTFREAMRTCLVDKDYTRISIFLQRLCSTKSPGGDPFTWRDFCKWHVPRIRK